MEESSRTASRCFMFMYFLLPHSVPATWRSLAQTSMRAELPSGKQPTTPILNVDICFLIQFANRCRRYLASPQRLGNVLHTPDRYSSQVHLNEGLFHAAFPATVPLNNCCLKGNPLELGHLEGDIPGSGGEIPAVVSASVALPLLVPLVPSCLGQLLRLGLQQFVEGFLYAAPHKFLELPLDYFFI